MAIGTVFVVLLKCGTGLAATTVFFNSAQGTNLIVSGTTSDTISSAGYLFILTRDKLFTGGIGLTNPIGRVLRVHWPDGLEAQAVTAGPVTSKARIDIKTGGRRAVCDPHIQCSTLREHMGCGCFL